MPPVVPLLQPGQPPGSAGNNARDTDIPRRVRIRARQCWNPSVADVIVNTRPDVGGLGRRNSPRVHDALETAFTISGISTLLRRPPLSLAIPRGVRADLAPRSQCQSFQRHSTDGRTNQAQRRKPHLCGHAPYLAVLTFA